MLSTLDFQTARLIVVRGFGDGFARNSVCVVICERSGIKAAYYMLIRYIC